jgi:hypothetical protein
MPPGARVRALVHAFIRSECEEATVRTALNDAAPFYRDAPEAAAAHAESAHIVQAFLKESAPNASDAQRALAGDLIKTTVSEVGSSFSAVPRQPDEIHAYADALADMHGRDVDPEDYENRASGRSRRGASPSGSKSGDGPELPLRRSSPADQE